VQYTTHRYTGILIELEEKTYNGQLRLPNMIYTDELGVNTSAEYTHLAEHVKTEVQ